MIQSEKVWRCNNCGSSFQIFCGDCNECGEDYGYTSTYKMRVLK